MAEIFLAKMQGYSGFEKLVALKRILPRYSQNPAFARMLIHEAKLAARLQHFNVVQVLDLGEIDAQVYIAMEYVRGRDLAALLSNTYRRKEKLPVPISLFMQAELLTGLDYAHRLTSDEGTPLGLIHRDISPQNVLISYEGEVKLTDFGIARVMEQHGDLRLPGNLHGKFGYMSPEQVEGRQLDQRSDIFSAGVVLHEMLTGQRLFRGKTPKATVEMIRSQPIPPPSSLNPEVPPAIDLIVAKALLRDREERYQTVGAFLGEISRAADRLASRASRRDLSVYMRRQFGAVAGREQSTTSSTSRTRAVSGFSPTAGTRVPLGEILIARGAVKVEQLEIALAEQRARGGRLGEILIESGVIDDDTLARALATQAGTRFVDQAALRSVQPNPQLLARFPRTAADGTLILPVASDPEAGSVTLAVADPYDQRSILESKIVLGVSETTIAVAPKSAIREAILRLYGPEPENLGETPLPVVESMIEESAPAPASERSTPVVVIGDSDLAGLSALAERLRAEEYEVHTASDGKAARTLCREKNPLVVLIDAALPGIDGYNVLLDLRSRNSDAAVFMTSSRSDGFHQAKALELGADDFLAKPLNAEVVASKVRREVQKRASGRPAAAPQVQFNGVSGSLQDMTALDIVQSLELGRKTAHVVLQYDDGRSGELGVVQGDLRSCVAGDQQGEQAFYRLARSGGGVFRIEYRAPSNPANITHPNTFLILEALRRIDEEGRASGLPARLSQPPSGITTHDLIGDLATEVTGRVASPRLNTSPNAPRISAPLPRPPPPAKTPRMDTAPMAQPPGRMLPPGKMPTAGKMTAPAAPMDPFSPPPAPPPAPAPAPSARPAPAPGARPAPRLDTLRTAAMSTPASLPPTTSIPGPPGQLGHFDLYRTTPTPMPSSPAVPGLPSGGSWGPPSPSPLPPSIPPGLAGPWVITTPAPADAPGPRYSGPPPAATRMGKQKIARVALQRVPTGLEPEDERTELAPNPRKARK